MTCKHSMTWLPWHDQKHCRRCGLSAKEIALQQWGETQEQKARGYKNALVEIAIGEHGLVETYKNIAKKALKEV